MKRFYLAIVFFPVLVLSQSIQLKQIVMLNQGLDLGGYIICADTDHDTLNELIFSYHDDILQKKVWKILEYRPMNKYQLVFADTGSGYPYPPGITTGNFEPDDVGDIDNDSLTDLTGPNTERQDSTFYLVTIQESPNYPFYPSILSWWLRNSNRGPSSINNLTPDLDRDGKKEIMTCEGFYGDTTRLMLVENINNNQNIPVWRRFTYGAKFALGDFDRDSLRDFVTANPGSSGEVYFFENAGDNQYDRTTLDIVYVPNGTDVFSGNDVDNDGHPEFFIRFARRSGGNWIFYLYMWEATGNNTFQRTLIDHVTRTRSDPGEMRSKCGDIDGDGIDEIIWSIASDAIVYKATGNNQFQIVWHWINTNPGPDMQEALVNIYDMNRNGYNEIVIANYREIDIFEVEAVRLLRPNGGDVFQDSTQEFIRWQKFYPPRCDSLSLFYSTDNGRTYQSIVHSLSSTETSYVWTVPSVNSDSCKIKIITYGPGWQYDETDGVFRISSTGIEEYSPLSALSLSLKVERRINPAAFIFSIPSLQRVNLKLYDINGRLVQDLVNETEGPGIYKINLNTKYLSSGIYFLSLEAEEKRIIERVVVIK